MGYGDVKIVSNSKYLKVEAGSPHDLRLLDDAPNEFQEHQTGDKPMPCTGEETCPLCHEGKEFSQRFNANVYDHTLGRVMIWKYGATIAQQLKSIANSLKEEGGDIMKTDLKVEAKGTGMQKRYTVTPRVNSKLVPAGLKRHELAGDIPF